MAIGYVAYVDEAGDDGIRRVRPVDPNGGSEWFVLGALVMPTKETEKIELEVKKFRLMNGLTDFTKPLHFNKLDNKLRAKLCELISGLNVRCFWVVSHKTNMRGYRNDRAAQCSGSGDPAFYNWIARMLLERISHYCLRHSLVHHKQPRVVRLEFSMRSYGMKAGFRRYLSRLKSQSKANKLFIKTGDISWPVVDDTEIEFMKNEACIGLQLADTVASGLYKGLSESGGRGGQIGYARLLVNRAARGANGHIFGHGLKFMPRYETAKLGDHQREIFEMFGAPKVGRIPRSKPTSGQW